jgi:ABC-type antimicrobial peptide transport system permease subunit
VLGEGALMAALGIAVGLICGYGLVKYAGSIFPDMRMPGAVPVIASAFLLLAAAVIASVLPAARAARVDVMQALRAD